MVLVEIQLESSLGHGNTPVVEIYFKETISIKTTTYRYFTSQWLAIVIAQSIAKVLAPGLFWTNLLSNQVGTRKRFHVQSKTNYGAELIHILIGNEKISFQAQTRYICNT